MLFLMFSVWVLIIRLVFSGMLQGKDLLGILFLFVVYSFWGLCLWQICGDVCIQMVIRCLVLISVLVCLCFFVFGVMKVQRLINLVLLNCLVIWVVCSQFLVCLVWFCGNFLFRLWCRFCLFSMQIVWFILNSLCFMVQVRVFLLVFERLLNSMVVGCWLKWLVCFLCVIWVFEL